MDFNSSTLMAVVLGMFLFSATLGLIGLIQARQFLPVKSAAS